MRRCWGVRPSRRQTRCEMRGLARLRSQMYATLARAFQRPEAASGADGEVFLMQNLIRTARILDARALEPVAERLVDALEIAPGAMERALRSLEIAFNRLFVGPGRSQAPPYESCYHDQWGLVMGPSARQVQRCYHEAGLEMVPDHHDLPDHVATELGFMAYLAMQEAEADDEEKETWRKREYLFLRDHLSIWIPLLCQRVKEASQHPFYAGLAELTETFVRLEMKWAETYRESQP